MSFKLFNAYRVRLPYLAETLSVCSGLMRSHVDDKVLLLLKAIKNPTDEGRFLDCLELIDRLYSGILKISSQSIGNRLRASAIDPVGYLRIWTNQSYAYIVPGGFYAYGAILAPEDVQVRTYEDYSYWNNTDRPSYLTARQWEARGNNWARAFGTAASPRPYLTHYFFEASEEFWINSRYTSWAMMEFADQDIEDNVKAFFVSVKELCSKGMG